MNINNTVVMILIAAAFGLGTLVRVNAADTDNSGNPPAYAGPMPMMGGQWNGMPMMGGQWGGPPMMGGQWGGPPMMNGQWGGHWNGMPMMNGQWGMPPCATTGSNWQQLEQRLANIEATLNKLAQQKGR